MKTLLRCSVAFGAVAICIAAQAADLPLKAPPASVPAAADWSGFYLGAHGGYGWGHDPATSNTTVGLGVPVALGAIDSKGYVVGGHVGYNWQYGAVVAGLELDMSATGITGSTAGSGSAVIFLGGPFPASATVTLQDKFDYLGTARARVGFLPWQNFLLYGTGGLAWTHFVQTNTTSVTFGGVLTTTVTTTPTDRFGWVAGIGGELALADYGLPHWLLRAEYLHYDFGSQASSVTSTAGFPSSGTTSSNLTADVVRGGLTFKFH